MRGSIYKGWGRGWGESYTLTKSFILHRNFGMGDTNCQMDMKTLKHQKSEFTMKVGKHSATVICKNKREGKQLAAQAILQVSCIIYNKFEIPKCKRSLITYIRLVKTWRTCCHPPPPPNGCILGFNLAYPITRLTLPHPWQ